MPASPSSSVQDARKAIAQRLRDLRLDAGLTGHQLSEACGWHAAKTSRIEHARAVPTDADIRAWCKACGADGQTADLIAATRTADSMYVEWRRLQRGGLRSIQASYQPLYERTRTFRVYCSNVMPGVAQTPEYAAALMGVIADFHGADPDDSAEAAQARIDRSQMVRRGRARFALLLEETVLRYRIGDDATMAGQLGHLLATMALPSVSVGIVPFTAQRRIWPQETFSAFDEECVEVELLTARVMVTAPTDVRHYLKAFGDLGALAVYGAAARDRIAAALDSLG